MSGSRSFGLAVPPEAGGRGTDQPLRLTVHSLPTPQATADGMRRRGRWIMLAVLLACAAPMLASYFTFYVVRPGGAGAAYGTLIDPPRPMPDAPVATLDGRVGRLPGLTGQWLLVVVDDARCGADCEKRLFMQRQLREMTGRERDRIDKLWLVLDGEPVAAPLRHALEAAPATHVLRMSRSQVQAWLAPEPGRRLEDHLYLVDPMGRWMMRAPADPDPARVRRDIDRLLRASAGWDRPGRPAPEAAPGTGTTLGIGTRP